MTEDLWLKMKSDRFLNPYIRRLLDLGLVQKSLYDLLKAGVAFGAVKVLGG